LTPPNVLLICVDHWPGRLLGVRGHPTILTPTLDQLAHTGILYPNAYSPTPTCVPARRELMTGTHARTHGDRVFFEKEPLPAHLPTTPQLFRNAGYQAYAVGKLHVYPQRSRIGFDDVILCEEGRHQFGMKADDYELFLAEQGYAGQEFTHGMGNNEYTTRPWHLPEYCHPTNWTTREMSKIIKRRDPTRPAFWYCSYQYPHPPLTPLQCYLDMYRQLEIDEPVIGDWARDHAGLPYALRNRRNFPGQYNANAIRLARQAFYAQCTHIDHQLRLLIGLLREEGILDNTIIAFTSDHGDMLGNHNLFAKGLHYDDSAQVPLLIIPAAADNRPRTGQPDPRLAVLADIQPTLLDLAGLPVPSTTEGLSLIADRQRDHIYGEHYEGDNATRMIRDRQYKLIYYPVGNRLQLFDLQADPTESRDLAGNPAHATTQQRLTDLLIQHLYGADQAWITAGKLTGAPDKPDRPKSNRGLSGQRGWRFMGG
jgi:arylsulfatase A-like enzyme